MRQAEWRVVVPAIVQADGVNGRWMRLNQLAHAVGIPGKELIKKFYQYRKGPDMKILFFDGTYAFIDDEGWLNLFGWTIEVLEEGFKIISSDREKEVFFDPENVEYADGRLAVRDWNNVLVASGWGSAIIKELREIREANGNNDFCQ